MIRIPWISPDDHSSPFPNVDAALSEPNGLLAMGGPLSPERLEAAYRQGIFPWFAEDQPVLWWSPDPRAVFIPGRMRLSRSLRKRLRQGRFRATFDTDFEAVIDACAAPRAGEHGTWITHEMRRAYIDLHRCGIGHSLEIWHKGELAGGLYGVSLGTAFFGESMFSRMTDASKVALAWLNAQLRRWDFSLIDCQMATPHLMSLGARQIRRSEFTRLIRAATSEPTRRGAWQFDPDLDP
ncbi:MAG TPA: leucyl/phenylalanyl-tRNA--protein transferase, partial [Gammaproteobacteria bacterium]|nr:leucyl/phenylalanyl-tRNA--protein transferase [Gammaproteobacteria bacterium]